jgi:16S rRNA processing protein RimM
MIYEDWNWTIGEVVAPFGRVGEMKVRILTDFPDRFALLKQVCLRAPDRAAVLLGVERTRLHKGQILLKLKDIESIDEAERWRGAQVQVRREEAVPLPEDSFYVADLLGLEVWTAEGRPLGPLEDVLSYPAQDLWKVGDILIPAVREFITRIDIPGRRIVVSLPAGFLPDEEPEHAD